MQVSFTRVDDKRYSVAVERKLGPALVPRFAPGYDDLMPHDLAHFVVERHFEVVLGVWGQLAAGGGGIFFCAPEDNTLRQQRRVQRIAAVGREDMARSEELVVLTITTWERRIGRVRNQVRPVHVQVDPAALQAATVRMDDVARRWQALQHGECLTLDWPEHLTLDVSKSHRGRQPERSGRRVPTRA